MSYFARFSPIRAVRDLRTFLALRKPHELWFMILAMAITAIVLVAFVRDSSVARVYRPQIVYVEQWTLDRTDAQIRAQQVVDQAKKEKDEAEVARREAEVRAKFQKVDDKLKSWGI